MDYDALAIEGLKEVFIQISDTCKFLEIEFFIVGAIARNIWYLSNDEDSRGTKDIDLGVFVPSSETYNALRTILKTRYNYLESSENAFCLISPDGPRVDLLPFGEIENDGRIMVEGRGLINIQLDGFKEAFAFGIKEVQIGADIYKTCSIPAIMILKLIAFDDNPEKRIKDIDDMQSICLHYPSLEADFIWANHFDLYDGDWEHEEVGLIVLGREMQKLVKENAPLKQRIVNILEKAIREESAFLSLMIKDAETETIMMKKNMIQRLLDGFSQSGLLGE